jgi:glycerate 2-kinase
MILLSPTAYKGTLSPWAAARLMARVLRKLKTTEPVELLPLADGGDGTLEVLLEPFHGVLKTSRVQGPLGHPVRAQWGYVKSRRLAILEMAQASGLKLVKGKNKILQATTFGTGQLIKAALDAGCRTILIGVGGTASSEGGAGALQALGLRYEDKGGHALSGSPQDLIRLAKINWKKLDPRLRRTQIIILCDVKNPLLGKNGSAATFGPQKGATPAQVQFLEKVLKRWSLFARYKTQNKMGTGAAGALAFGLSGFLNAQLVDGCRFIIEATGWKDKARQASLIVTGEGQMDRTSFKGKVIGAITKHRGGAPVGVICGRTLVSEAAARKKGIALIEEMGKDGLIRPSTALQSATVRLFRRRKGPKSGGDRRL